MHCGWTSSSVSLLGFFICAWGLHLFPNQNSRLHLMCWPVVSSVGLFICCLRAFFICSSFLQSRSRSQIRHPCIVWSSGLARARLCADRSAVHSVGQWTSLLRLWYCYFCVPYRIRALLSYRLSIFNESVIQSVICIPLSFPLYYHFVLFLTLRLYM